MPNVARYVVIPADRLKQANSSVTIDPNIMGGVPVFSGTRLPIDAVASAKAAGSSDECLIAAYPFLTPELIHDAEIYQQAHARRGRVRRLCELNPSWTVLESKTVRFGRQTPARVASAPRWPIVISFPNAETLPERVCDALYGVGLVDARAGLILLDPVDAGPNQSRTAKSSRNAVDDPLIGRVIAMAEQRGWATACADFSEQGEADPSVRVAAAVRASVHRRAAASQSMLRRFFTDPWSARFGSHACAAQEHLTLVSLLSDWYVAARRPLLLILNGLEQALATNEGRNVLTGVRAALDSMNSAQTPPRLMALLTAVDMDCLSELNMRSRAPFLGAAVVAHGTTVSLDGADQADTPAVVPEQSHVDISY